MFLTAATELGTNQWLVALLQGAGVSGILVLVFINGLMAIGRSFAGPIVHKLNPNLMLILSAVLAAVGLFLLSKTTGYAAFGAAFVFAAGVCFFWPTMLGYVAEYLPNTGALGLSLMGGAGMFSTSLIVPMMGKWYDDFKAAAVTANAANPDAVGRIKYFYESGNHAFNIGGGIILIYLVMRKKYQAHKMLQEKHAI